MIVGAGSRGFDPQPRGQTFVYVNWGHEQKTPEPEEGEADGPQPAGANGLLQERDILFHGLHLK